VPGADLQAMEHRVSRAVRLNLGYKLSDDAACKVTSDGIDELDKVDMMISFVRNGSDHDKRYITLMANLSYSCSLHLHTQGIRNFPSECVSQVGVELIAGDNQARAYFRASYQNLPEYFSAHRLSNPRPNSAQPIWLLTRYTLAVVKTGKCPIAELHSGHTADGHPSHVA